jgi:hypothetical protein
LKFLGLESWPPSARKVPILANFEADLKKYTFFFGPGPMGDVYLDFRLPWPAKIASGMLTPGKWWPFEIYFTTTMPLTLITHISAFPASNRMVFTKTKKTTSNFVITTILEHRRTVHASKSKITLMLYKLLYIILHIEKNFMAH